MAEQTTIEYKINQALQGDALKNALDFAAFLQAHGISFIGHDGGEGWSIMCKDTDIGFVLVNGAAEIPGPWTVWFSSCDFNGDAPVDDEVKETAWAYANLCSHFSSGGEDCGCGSQPGFTRTIFGRVFDNRCTSPLMFTNPDAKTVEHMTKLLLMLI